MHSLSHLKFSLLHFLCNNSLSLTSAFQLIFFFFTNHSIFFIELIARVIYSFYNNIHWCLSALKLHLGLQNKVRKKNKKRRGHRNKKRRRGGSAPLGVITNDNNVITRTLSTKKIKKTTENMADLNTKFFLNLLLWVDRTLGYPPFGAKGKWKQQL